MIEFATDPVACVLGKDVAQLIYYAVHKTIMGQLNEEYHRRLKYNNTKDGEIVFFESNTNRERFMFNYRSEQFEHNFRHITKWAVEGKIALDKVARVPKNYWHVVLPSKK